MHGTRPNDRSSLLIRFWGVRGSVPVPGPTTLGFGGNTSCVEVRCGDRLIILDGGTGLPHLGKALGAKAGDEFDLLLSHCHHDHIQGLMFFQPLLTKGCTTRIHAGHLPPGGLEKALAQMFSPPLFPVTFKDLPGRSEFKEFRAGDDIALPDGLRIRTHPLLHPSGATAYRIEHGGCSVCYVTDIEHCDEKPDPALVRFASGADLVIYDSMFSEEEFCRCRGWGHSTWHAGAALCRAAGAHRLAAFHHHPKYDDEKLSQLEAELSRALPGSFYAREGQTVTLSPVSSLAPAAQTT